MNSIDFNLNKVNRQSKEYYAQMHIGEPKLNSVLGMGTQVSKSYIFHLKPILLIIHI